MNDHINSAKVDTYTAQEFGIATYNDRMEFNTWLADQNVRFANAKCALKVYRGREDAPSQSSQKQRPQQTKRTFKSRRELNNFLRSHGYTWRKVAPTGEYEESEYGESFRWMLCSSDDREVAIDEALNEINSQ